MTKLELIIPANIDPKIPSEYIYHTLQSSIKYKVLKPGDKLPTREILGGYFGTSVNTVSVAVRRLTEEGWLIKDGQSFFISEEILTPEEKIIKNLQGLLDSGKIKITEKPDLRQNDDYTYEFQLELSDDGVVEIQVW